MAQNGRMNRGRENMLNGGINRKQEDRDYT